MKTDEFARADVAAKESLIVTVIKNTWAKQYWKSYKADMVERALERSGTLACPVQQEFLVDEVASAFETGVSDLSLGLIPASLLPQPASQNGVASAANVATTDELAKVLKFMVLEVMDEDEMDG